jgi:hypothetical protein
VMLPLLLVGLVALALVLVIYSCFLVDPQP